MYESPIEAIYENVKTQFDDAVLKAVQKVGINVDKGELIRALRYDRDQYNHGYSDGWYAKEESIVHCKDCKNHEWCSIEEAALNDKTFFCKRGERREG